MSDPDLNTYARRFRGRLGAALEPDETLLAAARVTFLGSADVSRQPRVPGEPTFIRRKAAYRRWAADVPAEFPLAGPDFVLGLTDRRWVTWRTTKWWTLPHEVAGSVPARSIHEVTFQKVLVSGVLTLKFRDGGQVLIESPYARRLRPLATAWERQRGA